MPEAAITKLSSFQVSTIQFKTKIIEQKKKKKKKKILHKKKKKKKKKI